MKQNKLFRNVFSAFIMALVFTVTAAAQDKAAEGAKAVTTQMKEQLTLNDAQYTKVYDVNLTFLQKAAKSKEAGGTKQDKTKKLRALEEERDTKLQSVLTETQYKMYAASRANNNKKLREYLPTK
jgi:hypothetical protein